MTGPSERSSVVAGYHINSQAAAPTQAVVVERQLLPPYRDLVCGPTTARNKYRTHS